MDLNDLRDAREYAGQLFWTLDEALRVDIDEAFQALCLDAGHRHLAQVALSMGYTIAPRKPLPSIATTAGDV